MNMKKPLVCIVVLFMIFWVMPALSAAKLIHNITLNNASYVEVAGGENIAVSVSVELTDSDEWNSTKYTIGNAAPVCLDTQDYKGEGTYAEFFTITSPAEKGVYTFKVWAYSKDECKGKAVLKRLQNAINVISECGDEETDVFEQCDDGNIEDNDGCSSACIAETMYYFDSDNDGYGDASDYIWAVDAPEGYIADSSDCNDSDETINPDASETCNGLDDNCDGNADEELERADGNLFGLCSTNIEMCSAGEWLDSGENYQLTEEVCDGLDNDCDGNADEGNFSDSDADGIKDCVDTDNDNDGVADDNDMIGGNSSAINTNIPGGLIFSVDGVQDEASHEGEGNITFADIAGQAVVEFSYDFANALDIAGINITADTNESFGFLIIKGINLSRQNTTKTAYIDRKAGTNTLCIIDDDVDSIVVEGDCSNGIRLPCSSSNLQYSCEIVDNSTRYKVSGLRHSAVIEYSYSAPPAAEPAQAISGNSGALIAVSAPKKEPASKKAPKEISESEKKEAGKPAALSVGTTAQPEEESAPNVANARSRLGLITGRVTNSIRNSPGAWGGGAGLAIAISLITAIYLSTRKVNKRYFRN